MKRWGHHYTLGVGVAGGLLLNQHPFVMLAAGFLLGVAATLSFRFLRRSAGKAGNVVDAQAALAWERVKEVRARRKAQIDKRRASREKLEREYRRGVIDGSL